MRCPDCGAETDIVDIKFCPVCGHSYDPSFPAARDSYRQRPDRSHETILVVVVVVVVVAVLIGAFYLTSLVSYGTPPMMTPAATYFKSSVVNGTKITIVSITKTDVPWDDVMIQLTDGTNFLEWNPRTTDLDGGAAMTVHYGPEALGDLMVSVTVTDLAGNGFVSSGDYFIPLPDPGFSSGASYSACLIYEPTGEKIGTGITFTG